MSLKTAWNLDLISKVSREKVKAETERFVNKWRTRADYLSDPKILAVVLLEYENYLRDYFGNAAECYDLELRSILDQTDPKVKAKLNLATEFGKEMENRIQFFELNLSKIPKENQIKFLKDQGLAPYKHFLEKLFKEGEHLLSDPEEKIINLKRTTAYDNWVKMTEEFLSREEVDGKNFSQIVGLLDSQNKKTRDGASQSLNKIFKKYLDVAERELNSVLADKKVNDLLRGFDKAEDARLLNDDVDKDMVESLITAVSGRNDLAVRFYELKAKLFKVKKLRYHERNVPYGNPPAGGEKKYSFDQAVALVTDVFASLNPKFIEIFKDFLANGQIDVLPKKGKHGGASCWHNLISQPTFVLLNHNNQLRDMTTLAHELGHGINNELVRGKQTALNFGTPISTAEVASTFMEDFVLEKLLEGANEELQLQLLVAKLGDEVGTIFRQVAFFQFERELHESFRVKGYLTSGEIGKLFQKHMKDYMGEFVEQSKGSENWWVYVSHFRSYFYVYSYASGLLISKYMQKMVRQDKKFIAKVVAFLEAGKSESPKSLFLKMGVDVEDKNFWANGVGEFESLLNRTWQLAQKLGKI